MPLVCPGESMLKFRFDRRISIHTDASRDFGPKVACTVSWTSDARQSLTLCWSPIRQEDTEMSAPTGLNHTRQTHFIQSSSVQILSYNQLQLENWEDIKQVKHLKQAKYKKITIINKKEINKGTWRTCSVYGTFNVTIHNIPHLVISALATSNHVLLA